MKPILDLYQAIGQPEFSTLIVFLVLLLITFISVIVAAKAKNQLEATEECMQEHKKQYLEELKKEKSKYEVLSEQHKICLDNWTATVELAHEFSNEVAECKMKIAKLECKSLEE